MNPIKFMKKLFISTYAVEVCKHLHELDIKHCCGCQVKNSKFECLMLTEDETIHYRQTRTKQSKIQLKWSECIEKGQNGTLKDVKSTNEKAFMTRRLD